MLPDGKAYLRAEVTYLDEDDGALTTQQQTRARELIEVYDAMLTRLAGRPTGTDLPADANQLSYQIAARLPLPPHERQELLSDATTAERLVRLARLMRREIALLQGTGTSPYPPAYCASSPARTDTRSRTGSSRPRSSRAAKATNRP